MVAIIKNMATKLGENKFSRAWFEIEDSKYKDIIEFCICKPFRYNEKKKKVIYGEEYSALIINFEHTTKAQNKNQFDDCRGIWFDDKTFNDMKKLNGYEDYKFSFCGKKDLNSSYYEYNEENILRAINFITNNYYNTNFDKLEFVDTMR